MLQKNDLKRELFKFWNESKEYFQEARSVNQELSQERNEMIKYIPDEANVLDIACGTAENSLHIPKNCKYTGIDISETALKMAEEYKNSNMTLIKTDVAHIPFQNNSFDVVISTYSFEHFLEPEKVLNEMIRVCKSKGKIIIISPTWDFPFSCPPSINFSSKSHLWRIKYILKRLFTHIQSAITPKKLFFEFVSEPEVFKGYKSDNDAVLILTVREIIKLFNLHKFKIIYARKNSEKSQKNVKNMIKLAISIILFPLYRYAGADLFIVAEKQ